MVVTLISAGQTSSGVTVINGDTLEVFSGGTSVSSTVLSGGIAKVESGGVASGTVINGGSETLSGGGTESYAQVHSGGTLTLTGGVSHFTTVTGISGGSLSGTERVLGGTAFETYVSSGGLLAVSGGTSSAVNVLVQGGGGMVVSAGATISGVDMTGGFNNLRGGTENGVLLANGGNFNISSGIVNGVIVEGNGSTSGNLTILSGGTASGVVIAGGSVEVQPGGVINGAIKFSGTGGTLKIDSAATGFMLGNTISGFESGNSIDLTNDAIAPGATATLLGGDVLQISEGGRTYDLQLSTSQNFNGETFTASDDGFGGTKITTSQPIHISGSTVASVQKDTFTTDTGTLTATDSTGSAVTWSVSGGTTPHAPDYQFAIDQFQVVKSGSAEFTDNFSSTTPPNFSDGQTGKYTVFGTLANNGSQDLLLGSNAGTLNGIDGQIAYLNSDTSTGSPTDGLFSGTSFTVKGTFDLVIPTDPRTTYGISLTDKDAGDGHDVVRLVVTRNINNQVLVQLQEINNVTGSTDFLQSIALNPAAGDDRIELDLSNNGAVNNGAVKASFTLFNDNTVDSTTTFTQTGQIFVPENGVAEDWTQAAFLGLAPAVSDSIATGTYGTLDLEQNGTWAYGLNNSSPAVQGLTEQQSGTDNFQVTASDGNGNSTTTQITATVAGDSPVLSIAISGVTGEGAAANGTHGFNQFIAFGDSNLDSGYFFTHPISNNPTTQAQYLASMAAGGGIPTSLGGVMNSTLLAQDFGLTAIPVGEAGGTNYAASGATVRNNLSSSLAPNINSQVASYLSSNGTANPNALYLVAGGGNDEKIADQLSPVGAQEYMIESATQFAADLIQLHAAGAQYIVIHDLGTGGADGSLGAIFNATLQQDLVAAGVPFVLEDFSSLIQKIDADPAAYGITNITAPPVGPFTGSNAYNPVEGGADINPNPATINNGWSLEATQLASPTAGETDLWSDDEHLSAAGQAIEANYIYNLVENAVPTVGETLTANPTLTGSSGSTANIVYQWQSQSAGQPWSNISGATNSSYVVQAGDLGANLRVVASFTDPNTGELVTTDNPATFAVVATSATWLPGVSGDWSTAADWTAGSVPASTSNVVFDNLTTSPNTITIAITGSHSAQSLTLNDAGTTVIDSAGTLTLAGALTIDSGRFILQGGNVSAAEGLFVEGASPGGPAGGVLQVKDGSSLTGSVVDNGVIDYNVIGTNSFTGSLTGDGKVVVEGGGHLLLNGSDSYSGGTVISAGMLELGNVTAAGAGEITFAAGGHATLQIDGPLPANMPANTIGGFAPGDIIHLENVAFDSAGSVILGANNKLQITEGGKTYDLQLDSSEDFSGDVFHLAAAADHSTLIEATACYCPGTLILTSRGERPIEQSAIGDRLVTKSGARRRIRWIGRRSYAGRFATGQKHILPICIKAGALEDKVPRRDLWISPQHAMYLEGVLIEAKDLVNGVSIVQAEQVEKVEYVHLELDSHDVIIAEGALSESFLDDDSRGIFHNAPEYHALYPDAANVPVRYCAPRCNGGYAVAAARNRIDARAGLLSGSDTETLPLRGYVDAVTGDCISGWAQNPEHPEAPVCLDILGDGRLIGQTLAIHYREDLERAGLGSGQHAFDFAMPAGISAKHIEVRRSLDQKPLAKIVADIPALRLESEPTRQPRLLFAAVLEPTP